MTNHRLLENYLNRLDKALSQLPISDRAEIVTEIKSHVLDALDSQGGATIESVLSSLGEPEQVANKYLLERGVRTVKSPVHPIFKWTVIGFLGTFSLFVILVIFVLSYFSPILEVNEAKGRVRLLGGMIDVDEQKGLVTLGGSKFFIDDELDVKIEGSFDSGMSKNVKEFNFKFSNGKLDVLPSQDGKLTWNCKAKTYKDKFEESPKSAKVQGGRAVLDLDSYMGSKCILQIPQKVNLVVKGGNGKVHVDKPDFDVDIDLGNGKVGIDPDPAKQYSFNTHVTNGVTREFTSSEKPDALKIKVAIVNGKIE
ncbi:MAG: DUF1700 domain-containing protein [Bdellovibrionales bacterium]|nr:DUF1700 domain-containing protein [Bdellovibrionales bacterium]